MEPRITEIAADVYQITVYVQPIDLQFSHFLVNDDEPLLFHTGYKKMFPLLRDAVARVIDPAKLRWISFSHFESDECGALNEWLETAPHAEVVASPVGVAVNLDDFAIRPPKAMTPAEVLETGKYRFRYHPTAQLPHGWDAGVLFEETRRTLFCSDLLHHNGDVEPHTSSSVIERAGAAMSALQASPLADYVPVTHKTRRILESLAALQPRTLALMHGSAFIGDGAQELRDLWPVMRDRLGEAAAQSA